MNNYYTYAYLRQDGTPYYIGKGTGQRINSPNHTVGLPEIERRIYLKQNLTEEQAYAHEAHMIAVLGRKDLGTGILWNRTDGGETPGKGRKWTAPQRIEKSKQQQGERNSNWKGGISKAPDYRKNLAQSNREIRNEWRRQWRARRRAAGLPVT